MTSEERAELRRADKVEGLADEISLLRMRMKRAAVEEREDLEMLSLGLDRLSRAIAIQHQMLGKQDGTWLEKWEETLRAWEDNLYPDGMDRPWWCLPPREEDDWEYWRITRRRVVGWSEGAAETQPEAHKEEGRLVNRTNPNRPQPYGAGQPMGKLTDHLAGHDRRDGRKRPA